MFVSMTHIAREVANIESCIAFYRSYCGFEEVHRRKSSNGGTIVWIGEPSKSDEFIFVLMSGGEGKLQEERNYDHPGFALAVLDSRGGDLEGGRSWMTR